MQSGLTISEVIMATGGRLYGRRTDVKITDVSTDTRKITGGEIFVALKGQNFDGHNFVKDAFRKGAVAAIVKSSFKKINPDWLIIRVKDPLKALGDLASFWRSKFNVNVIGITGSNGKTTTKELVSAVLAQKYNVLSTEGNMNNLIGVPLMLFKLQNHHQFAVLEFGTSRFGEIGRICEIVMPDAGIITNIGPAHLEYFKSIKGVLKEKTELARKIKGGPIIYNRDDELLHSALRKKYESLTFGFNRYSDIRCTEVLKMNEQGSEFAVQTKQGKYVFTINLPGQHNITNALAAIAAGIYGGLQLQEINTGLKSVYPMKGRWQVVQGFSGVTIVDDSYNSNPVSLLSGLKEICNLYSTKRITAVIGDMLELGRQGVQYHRRAGEALAQMRIHRLITVGSLAKHIAAGAVSNGFYREKTVTTRSTEEAIEILKKEINEHDVIYIKGSRGMQMEKIVEALGGK